MNGMLTGDWLFQADDHSCTSVASSASGTCIEMSGCRWDCAETAEVLSIKHCLIHGTLYCSAGVTLTLVPERKLVAMPVHSWACRTGLHVFHQGNLLLYLHWMADTRSVSLPSSSARV